MKVTRLQVHYLELFVAAIILLVANSFSAIFSYVSNSVLVLNLLITLLFLSFAIAYVLRFTGPRPKRASKATSVLMHSVFALIVVAFVSVYVLNGPLAFTLELFLLKYFQTFGILFTVFLPLFFLSYLGSYFYSKGNRKAAFLFILATFLILVLYYASKFLVKNFSIDDEELLVMQSVTAMLHGINPYTVSFTRILYNNASIGLSTSTSNMIVGVLDYPALFMLAFTPFYFLSTPTMANLGAVDSTAQAAVYIFAMLMALAFCLDSKELLHPRLTMLAFFIIAIVNIASITTFLMIALLIVAYARLSSRYSWIPLGLCLAIQEELWVPVILLLIYSVNNEGMKAGAKKSAGALAVFLAINAPFIITAPSAYFRAVFTPLNSLLLPSGSSAIGFSLIRYLPLPLPTYPLLFEMSAVTLALVLLFWNRKKLIPIFSVIPFLLLQHSINAYYATFIFLLIFALGLRENEKQGAFMEWLGSRKRHAAYASIAAFAALFLAVIYVSHASFVQSFNMSSSNTTLFIDRANASSVYRTTLHYSDIRNDTVYVLGSTLDTGFGGGFAGLINDSIISPSAQCNGDIQCLVNVNKIQLNGASGTYNITARIGWFNSTKPIEYVSLLVYNGKYLYLTPSALNVTS